MIFRRKCALLEHSLIGSSKNNRIKVSSLRKAAFQPFDYCIRARKLGADKPRDRHAAEQHHACEPHERVGHSAHVRQNDFVGEPCENGHAAMGVITARAGDALCIGRDLDRPLGSFFELGAWSPSLPGSFSSTDAAIRRSGASAPYRNRVLRAGECPFGRKEHRPST
jgi:hypothetical protein